MMGLRNTDVKDAKACLGPRRKLIMPSNGKNAHYKLSSRVLEVILDRHLQ
jgi:hypothetical protein